MSYFRFVGGKLFLSRAIVHMEGPDPCRREIDRKTERRGDKIQKENPPATRLAANDFPALTRTSRVTWVFVSFRNLTYRE